MRSFVAILLMIFTIKMPPPQTHWKQSVLQSVQRINAPRQYYNSQLATGHQLLKAGADPLKLDLFGIFLRISGMNRLINGLNSLLTRLSG